MEFSKITVNSLVPCHAGEAPESPTRLPAASVTVPLLGRAAWPSDFAPLTRFLLGPGARYITGQIVNVNGGTYFGT